MNITMESDYAIRILYCLAKSSKRLDAKTISTEVNVTLRFSLKILRKLVMAGIVKSFKGTNGGYQLAHDPADISFAHIIQAIEGPIQISRCLDEDAQCSRLEQKSDCPFHLQFDRINQILLNELEKVTLKKILK